MELKFITQLIFLSDICFVNQEVGYIISGYGPPNPISKIWKTTNGGINWVTLIQQSIFLNSIFFKDSLNGIAAGFYGPSILLTNNAGVTWNPIWSINIEILSGIYTSSGEIFVVGMKQGSSKMSSSSNGGQSWIEELTVPGSYNQFRGVFFINSNTGWVVGYPKLIYKTTNGGLTFAESTINVIPDKYSLSQNYPNPFNPTTKISFALPKQGLVTIKVFDMLGKEIETLVNESLKPGKYEAAFDGSSYPSGVYFYRLTISHGGSSTDGFTETKRMVLIK